MTTEYYSASGTPSTSSQGASASMRGEFSLVEAGFAKLPALSGNGNKVVTVNSGGTALTATAATALSGMAIGTNVQAWDADLDALAALAATAGMLARTGAGAFAVRTLTGTANEVTVTNGDGSGTPTFSLPATLTLTGKTVTVATQSAADNSTKAASTAYADAAATTATFPAGTKVLFAQTAAPTGWTKDTTHNDKALRVVSGTASSGGATAFTSVFGSGKTTGSTVLTGSNMPTTVPVSGSADINTQATNGGATFNMPYSSSGFSGGSGTGHTHTLSLDLQYVDVIIATKN